MVRWVVLGVDSGRHAPGGVDSSKLVTISPPGHVSPKGQTEK